MSSSHSRRQFFRHSTGAAALVLADGCASRPPPAPALPLRGATISPTGSQGGMAAGDLDVVVKPTPCAFFTSRDPGSREMNWGAAKDYGDVVPNERFYVHSRVRPPKIDAAAWRLEFVGDAVGGPTSLTFEQLLAMPQVTVRRVLDCGANCRAFFPRLPAKGGPGWLPIGFTQWHFGAVGAADFTGVRMRDVLDRIGVGRVASVMFTGLDSIPANGGHEPYAQVIPIDKVLAADTLLVHRMNGEPLPVDHGYPVRVIFSGWGGNTAVKWLGRIELSTRPIPHPWFQSRQIITGPDIPKPFTATVGHVRSALEVDADTTLAPGDITLRGRAWSGAGAIDRVDVTVEKLVAPDTWRPIWTPAWRQAQLLGTPEPFMWVWFEVPWAKVDPGRYRVMTRARDATGNVQPRPEDVLWNQQGLGYNGHAPLAFTVLEPTMMP